MVRRRALHPLGNYCGRDSSFEVPQADAIVELSSGRHPSLGSARLSKWHDPDRFLAGLKGFRDAKALRLPFTGVLAPFIPANARMVSATSRKPHCSACQRRLWRVRLLLLNSASYFRLAHHGCIWSKAPFACAGPNACMQARGCSCCPSLCISRLAGAGPVRSGETIPSSCPAPRLWTTAHAPCGNCWSRWSIEPGN